MVLDVAPVKTFSSFEPTPIKIVSCETIQWIRLIWVKILKTSMKWVMLCLWKWYTWFGLRFFVVQQPLGQHVHAMTSWISCVNCVELRTVLLSGTKLHLVAWVVLSYVSRVGLVWFAWVAFIWIDTTTMIQSNCCVKLSKKKWQWTRGGLVKNSCRRRNI